MRRGTQLFTDKSQAAAVLRLCPVRCTTPTSKGGTQIGALFSGFEVFNF